MYPSVPFALRPVACCVLAACCELAAANPTGASVAAGAATFQNAAKTLTVTNAPGTIINWQGFSIPSGETTRFIQQSAASAVLNRVVGPDPSSLLGTLSSNGRVFLINTNGIVVGAGARIDTAGFIASTLNITDTDFLQGRLRFEGGGAGALRNAGTIQASGDIMLVGPQIENTGIIRSENGAVLLAAGRKLTITSPDAQGVRFELQAPGDSALNVGTLDARTAATMFAGTLRHSGDIRVGGASVDGTGRVTLIAQKDAIVDKGATITANGTRGGDVTVRSGELTWVEGAIEAKGSAGPGGTVHLLGERVGLSGATVDVSGETGGGTILVGGDFQGRNPEVPNAKATYVGPDATLKADAVTGGDGGKVIVWADDTTRVHGAISARGGAQSGDGGFVETSGHYLEITSVPNVGAAAGRGGAWLLDPGQITISDAPADLNITPASPFAPAVANGISTLTSATINSALFSGDVTIATGIAAGGPGNGDIVFDASASPPSSGLVISKQDMAPFSSSVLRLDAARDIRFTNGGTTFQTSGGGNPNLTVELRPGLGGNGGVFTDAGASVTLTRATGAGSVFVTLRNGAVWQNSGTVTITPGAAIRLFDEMLFSSFINQPVGIVNVGTPSGAPFLSDSATPNGVLQNAGTINVGAELAFEAAFSNTGLLNINTPGGLTLRNAQTIAGTVAFSSGGSLELPRTFGSGAVFDGTTVTGTGTIRLGGAPPALSTAAFRGVSAANATLRADVNGTANLEIASSTFRNVQIDGAPPMPGQVPGRVNANATLTILDTLTLGGTLGGTSAAAAPNLNWNGGTIQGSGLKTFNAVTSTDSAGSVHLAGEVALAPGGTWTNNGTLLQDGAGHLVISSGATVSNPGLSNWNVTSTHSAPITGPGTFNNAGAFSNAGATPHAVAAPFVNTGIVNVADGTALVLGPGGATPDTGIISIGNGSITFDGNRTLGLTSSLSSSGGTIQVSGGTLDVNGAVSTSGPLSFTGGTATFSAPPVAMTPSTLTVNGGTAVFFRPLSIGGSMTVTAGRANFNEPVTVGTTLALSNGTLGGTGPIGVTGLTAWSGGAMDGSGTTTVNGGLAINGNATKSLLVDRRLDIPFGTTATWSGGTITIGGNARINNSGTWSDQTPGASMLNAGGVANFNNTGAYNKTAAGVTTMGVAFNNSGTGSVDVAAGGLSLAGGGASSRPFNVTGSLEFASDYAVNAGSDIAGTGSVAFTGGTTTLSGGTYNVNATSASGGNANFSPGVVVSGIGAITITGGQIALSTGTPITAPSLNLLGGAVSGSDALTVSGLTTWSAGSMSGTGSTVASGGTTLTGVGLKTLTRTFRNPLGATVLANAGGLLQMSGGGRIDNQGAWSDQSTGFMLSGGGSTSFANTGTYTKTVAGTTTLTTAFNNTGAGSASVQAGRLELSGGGTSDRPFSVSAAATLELGGGTHTLAAGANVTGAGAVIVSGGTVNFNGGTYDITGATTVTAGTATFAPAATVNNVGALTVSGGTLTFDSGESIGAPTLNLSGGTLGGGDSVTVTGATTWAGGAMTGAGTTNANGGLTVNGPGFKDIGGGRTLNNNGTATWANAGTNVFGYIRTGADARINNNGTWIDQTINGLITHELGGSAARFVNTGTYTKGTPGTTTVQSGTAFDVSGAGSVQISNGTLDLQGGGIATATLALPSIVGSIDLSAGTYTFGPGAVLTGSGTLNLSGASVNATTPFTTGVLVNMSGGIVNTSGTLALTKGIVWSGGTITGSGSLSTSGASGVSGTATLLDTTWDNFGTLTLQSGTAVGRIVLDGAGSTKLDNHLGATIINQSTSAAPIAFANTVSGKSFVNAGRFVKASRSAAVQAIDVPVVNSGTLEVAAGRLQLTGGGTHSGAIAVDTSGTVLELAGGTHQFDPGVSLTGSGTLELSAGSLKVVPAVTSSPAWRVSGGTLDAAGNLTLNGAFDWLGGTLTGSGVLNTGAASTTTITGNVVLADKVWNNFGNAAVSGSGSIALAGDGTLPTAVNNRAGGFLNLASASSAPLSAVATLVNKSFTNAGTLNVSAGPAGAQFDVSTTNTGTFNANAGTVSLPRFEANDGTLNIASAAIVATGGNALTNNGTIGGAGTLDLGAANTLTNLGTLRPGAAAGDTTGTLTITGNLTQGATGVIDLELGGTGIGAFDTLAISGTAALAGTVKVVPVGGYAPVVGDAFQVVTAGARTGNFSTVNKTFATNMTAGYGATSLTFTVGGGPVNSWISTSGDWSVGGNWSLGHVPTVTETALLDQPGVLTITVPAGTFTTSAVTSNENLAINGGTLSLASASTINAALGVNNGGTLQSAGGFTVNGPLTLAGGTVSGAGGVTVTGSTAVSGISQVSGPLTVGAFTMAGGSLTVNSGGMLNLTSAAAKSIENARLTNAGTLNIAGSDVTLSNAALLENSGVLNLGESSRIALSGVGATELANRSGGVINDRSSNATPVTGTAGTRFTNAGTLNKTTAAATQSLDVAFDNSRQVNIDAGTLVLTQGGADNGTYNVPSGTVLSLASGSRDFNTGVALAGGGTLRISGATLNVNTPLTQASSSPALDLQAGTVNNAAGLALNGVFTWSGGTVTGAGTLTTGTTATTAIDGIATLSSTRWTNFGPVALGGGGRIVLAGTGTTLTTFDNRSGGVITDTSAAATPIGFAATRASTRFDNSGRFIKAAGSAAIQTLDVPMTNTSGIDPARLDVQSGTLIANGFPNNAGVIDISSGATFSTAGAPLSNAPNAVVRGNGTLDVGASAFTNHGFVTPGASPGTLTIAGNYVQAADGVLAIELQGLLQGVEYDLLKVTGNAALDGTLALIAPHPISSGSNFQVITYASRTGDFAVKTSPPGLPFNATPGATSYDVTQTAELGDNSTLPAQFLNTRDVFGDRSLLRDPQRGDRDQRDPRDPREERRRVLPECR